MFGEGTPRGNIGIPMYFRFFIALAQLHYKSRYCYLEFKHTKLSYRRDSARRRLLRRLRVIQGPRSLMLVRIEIRKPLCDLLLVCIILTYILFRSVCSAGCHTSLLLTAVNLSLRSYVRLSVTLVIRV